MPPTVALSGGGVAGFLLVLAVILPVAGVLLSLAGGRHAERIALVLMPAGLGIAARDPRRGLAIGHAAGLPHRRLGAAARHRAARRRAVGGDAGHHGAGDLRRRPVRARRLQRMPAGAPETRAPLVFWTLLMARLGRAERGLARRRPVQPLRRAGAADLRRRAAGVPGRPRRNAGRGAALPAVRAARLGALPARRGAALRRLWHARHRAAGRPGASRAGRLDRRRADDGGAAGQDRAVPAASVAAARPCRRAGARPARCCRRWWSKARSSWSCGCGST